MQKKTFEIGLVMAGAISAGTYTAGVVDYLLQALKEWENIKENNPQKAPTHNVKLKVIAGASAGGMTGAITSSMVNGHFDAITSLPERYPDKEEISKNKLYSAWVEQIDISELLGDNDLEEKGSKVVSLLDSTILEKIAESTIQFKPADKDRSFLADQLHLYLTLTNLHGIPYYTTYKGESDAGHGVVNHKDYYQFLLSDRKSDNAPALWLNTKDDSSSNWDVLKNAAIATGAFPGGLAPRVLNRAFSQYDYRQWYVPSNTNKDASVSSDDRVKYDYIEPAWPPHDNNRFKFLAVDGGVMDNEPTGLARRSLVGNDGQEPEAPEEAFRSLLLIDPFPTQQQSILDGKSDVQNKGIFHVLMKLLDSMKSQSRFNPDNLELAASEEVYNRFLIAPTRYEDGRWADYPIASGSLHGFGGFLSQKFRRHDFQLGRRNCQQFLKKYFTIPVEKAKQNSVFANCSKEDFKRFSFRKSEKAYMPIIPLLGECKKEEQLTQWESLKMSDKELHELQSQITGRTKIVVNRLIEQHISGIGQAGAKFAAWIKRDDMVNKIMKVIKDDLKEFNLY